MKIRVDVLGIGESPRYQTSNSESEYMVPLEKLSVESLQKAVDDLGQGEEDYATGGVLVFGQSRDVTTGEIKIDRVGAVTFSESEKCD